MHDWQYFFNHDRSNLNQATYRIFESEYKAEILHWFSREDVDKQQKEDFIQALIDFDDGCGDFYRYRAYFLAAEAIAKFPECSLADAIVEQLLKWSYGYFRQDKRDWQILPQPLVKTARKTLELTDKKRVITAFVHLVHTTESRSILRVAAEKLGKLDPGNKSAIAALALMPIVEDVYEYCQPSYSLGEIAVGDETAITAFIHDIQTMPNAGICWHGIAGLGNIAYQNETAIAALIHLIETTQNKRNCQEAIASLGRIADGNQNAIATLMKFLQINQGDNICLEAAEALWKIDPGNALALKALVYILETARDTYVIVNAAEALWLIEPENKIAIYALSNLLETTPSEWEHLDAAEILMKIDPGNPKAIATLCHISTSVHNIGMRSQAAKILVDAVQNLERIDPDNQLMKGKLREIVYCLVQYIQVFQEHNNDEYNFSLQATDQFSYESCLLGIADSLTRFLPVEHLPQVLTSLKDYLNQKLYKNSSYRYEAVLKIIWHCAEKMNYPDFYKLWLAEST